MFVWSDDIDSNALKQDLSIAQERSINYQFELLSDITFVYETDDNTVTKRSRL